MARSDTVTVTISGPVGCGKSAIAGEIEIALKAIGVQVSYQDEMGAQSEKRMTHADWQTYIEMYKPNVVLVERIVPRSVPRPLNKENQA